ncbi:exopolyphosphatase [Frankia sp. CcI49]|uniref:acyclic terpene utilization AtuA family protein n=1 Tax=Frankia sp. CcI49 TaxID=1745382 RepID=UPI0009788EBD|nr:acyclic terpene utilization AtuA family protein [Frankia sp. CcI49]ONH58933.1 exopolyphosphatase [Frankia sp. CcI49]
MTTGAQAQAGGGPRRPVRIANCSGFFGDRLDAARLMVDGGPIDVLTGDYLAELTMLILHKTQGRPGGVGYVRTFLRQVEDVLGTCLERGIRIVANAGGLDPAGLAEKIRAVAAALGLRPNVAYVSGDDIVGRVGALQAAGEAFTHLDTGRSLADVGVEPITANAYLGGWGIATALSRGADIVITGRVTDASLVVGPAAWWHNWERTDWDRLAGAVAAGHVIECGPQACGGNYAFLDEITDRRYPGFPLAEIAADGSSVITKHRDTGGTVTTGTVTAQLLYEIAGPRYPNPDVTAHFDTIRLTGQGPDRVLLSGSRGTPPSDRLKVAMNYLGGYRNTVTMVLTGLDIEEKAAWARRELFDQLGGEYRFDAVDVQLLRFDQADAASNPLATAHLRITVKDRDARKVGRSFSDTANSLFLGGYAGFHTTGPPGSATAYGVYWPALVSRDAVAHTLVLADATTVAIPHSPSTHDVDPAGGVDLAGGVDFVRHAAQTAPATSGGATARVPLGLVAGARSGDKGGNANVGLWARSDAAYRWLAAALTVETFRELIPEARGLPVHRYDLANLRAVNFVVVGLLGEGVASSVRLDPQAKGLGEYVRSRLMDIPVALLHPQPVVDP